MQLNNPELFLWGFLFGFGDTNLPWRSGWPAGVWVPEESLHSLAEFHHLKRRVEPVHRHTNGPVQLHTKVLAACVNISASEVEEGTFIYKDWRFLMIEMPGPSSTHCSFEIYLQTSPFQLAFSNRCSYVGFILFPVKYFQLAGKKKQLLQAEIFYLTGPVTTIHQACLGVLCKPLMFDFCGAAAGAFLLMTLQWKVITCAGVAERLNSQPQLSRGLLQPKRGSGLLL